MNIANSITEKSNIDEIRKALVGTYQAGTTEQYWTTTIGHLCIVQALTDCTLSLKNHQDFYHNNKLISKNINKIQLSKGDTILYYCI